MKLREFYEQIGSDYQPVLDRFLGDERILEKFVRRFLEESTFGQLEEAVQKQDYQAVECEAHALKGVCANLGFERLREVCGELVSCVRENRSQDVTEDFPRVAEQYGIVCKAIKKGMDQDD